MSLSTSRLENKANPTKQYDDEFKYDEQIEEHLPDIMARIEEGDRVSGTTQTKEEAHRLNEMNRDAHKDSRFPDQDELKQRRTGRIFHMNTFIDLLKKTGLNCWYTNYSGTKAGDTLGLFVGHEGLISPRCSHAPGAPHYVGFVQVPYMQEYEELYFDDHDLPLGSRRRGWRTIGLMLIEQKLVTEEKFHEVFGAPHTGPVSRRYLQYLSYLRHLPL
jgi:hypothetical protein